MTENDDQHQLIPVPLTKTRYDQQRLVLKVHELGCDAGIEYGTGFCTSCGEVSWLSATFSDFEHTIHELAHAALLDLPLNRLGTRIENASRDADEIDAIAIELRLLPRLLGVPQKQCELWMLDVINVPRMASHRAFEKARRRREHPEIKRHARNIERRIQRAYEAPR